jgi:hypothetical protein
MPVKRKGKGLTRNRKVAKKVEKTTVVPSPPTEELPLVPVENEERLPDDDFFVDDDTQTILRATSDNCSTLNAQATRIAIAYCYLNVFGAPPPEDWDGRDGTMVQIRKFLKISMNSGRCVRQIISQVLHSAER